MKSKETKRSLFLSIISLLLCFSMLIGSTFAWFTATVKTEKNEIVVGNLDVEMEYSFDFEDWKTVNTTTKLFKEEAFWQPGYSEVVYLKVKNAGDLSFRYQLFIKINEEQVAINKNDKIFKLSDYIKVGAAKDITSGYSSNADAILEVENDAIALRTFSKNGVIEAGEADQYFALVVYMPESVGNAANYRGEAPTIDFGVSLYATQIEGDFSNIADESQFVSITGAFTDTKIVDETTAIQAVQESSDLLGLGNATDELTVANVSTVDGSTYYRLQQNHNGIPIYGRNIVVIADENSNAQGITSNVVNVGKINSTLPTVTQEMVEMSFQRYCLEQLKLSLDSISIPLLDEKYLYLYNIDEQNLVLVYVLPSYSPNGYNFIVNATTAEILSSQKTLFTDMTTGYNSDGSLSFDVSYENEEYILFDESKAIAIWSLNGKNSKDGYGESILIKSDNAYFGDSDNEKNLNYDTAVDLYYTINKIYDYFEQGVKMTYPNNLLYVFYDDMYDDGNNARGGSSKDDRIGIVSIGKNKDVTSLDLIGHEFMHSITRTYVDWNGKEASAINEGLSDIFGELVEGFYSQSKQPDWTHGTRTIYDPSINGYPEKSYAPENGHWQENGIWYTEDYSHGHSTVISYAAYLMNNGVNGQYPSINLDTLAMLWYRTMLTLPSNCTFDVLYDHMLLTADIMGLSEATQECISVAFFEVGIYGNAKDTINSYCNEIELSIFDKNGILYNNCSVCIEGYNGVNCSVPYSETFEITESKSYTLQLETGAYKITVTDNCDETNIYSKIIKVYTSASNNELIFVTDFGSPYSEGLEYTLNSDKISYSVTGIGTCTDAAIIVPGKYNNLPVTAIGRAAFGNCKTIQSIVIPKGVTKIGEIAFYRSTLIDITLPDTITLIDNNAFKEAEDFQNLYFVGDESKWCQIQIVGEYQYPFRDAIKYFNGVIPTKYKIPEGITAISDWAFAGFSELEEISISNSVLTIGEHAFIMCEKLNNVILPAGLTVLGKEAFEFCTSLESIVIPKGITIIDNRVFRGCSNLKEVVFHENITSIGYAAFESCGFITIDIPKSVVEIGEWAFYGCQSLTNISTGGAITIGSYAFGHCNSLVEVEIAEGTRTLSTFCISSDFLSKLKIPNSVTWISSMAIYTPDHLNIEFDGTMQEWENIPKDNDWAYKLRQNDGCTIHCLDGTIEIKPFP